MPQALLPIERTDAGIVTLTLSAGDRGVVVLNRDFIESIDRSLDDILSGAEPNGLVLASEGRVFVAGADLGEIMSLDDDALIEYLELGASVFARFAAMPCHTVAAVHGATLGGGLELAMHCDTIVAATPDKPYPIGLPEAGLHICPGWGGTNLLPARAATSTDSAENAIRMSTTGQTFSSPRDAADAGLIAELTTPDNLLDRARDIARSQPATPTTTPRSIADHDVQPNARAALDRLRAEQPATEAAAAVLDCVQHGLEHGFQAACQRERTELARLRHTAPAQQAIEAFFAKSAKE